MKQLRALKGHSYANKFQKVGAIYNASDSDANLMVLLKNSEYFTAEVVVEIPKEEPKAKRPYVRRNLQADRPSGYTTKDMKAN
jgi:hypothetical protein